MNCDLISREPSGSHAGNIEDNFRKGRKRKTAVRACFKGQVINEDFTMEDGSGIKGVGRRTIMHVDKMTVSAGTTTTEQLNDFAWTGLGTSITLAGRFTPV